MANARFAWGIDIGNRALKAVRLVRDGNNQLKIDDFEVIEHEQILSQAGDNRESLIQTALANFTQRQNIKGGAIAIGVSGQSSFARFIKLPPVEPKKIPEIVRFEAIQQIPFPLDEVEWAYQLFQNDQSPDVEVGIFAMRKDLVNQNIRYFTDVGMNVHAVQTNPLAVYNALYHDQRIKGATMIIDLGAENTDLIIAEGESIWMRSISIGGNNFTEALVKQFKLKFNKAEELKRNAATSKYGRQILQAMRTVFADLVAEIQRSIGFYASTHRDSRISRVLALGGTFKLPGLQKYLQQNLQLDVARVDRLGTEMPADARFLSTFNDNVLSAVSAYGLALQALGEAKISSSLLPEHIRRERMWGEKTKWFAAAAALFVVGTGLYSGRVWFDQYSYDSKKPVRDSLAAVVNQATRLDTAWKNVESSGADDRKQISILTGAVNDRNVVPHIVEDIGGAFPSMPAVDSLKKIPRGQRKVIELEGWKMSYFPDLSTQIAMPETQFTGLAEKFDIDSEKKSGFGTDNTANQGSGGPQGKRKMIKHTGAGISRMHANVNQGGDNPAGPARRGYIITIRCRTSNSVPAALVNNTVVKALADRNQNSPNPPQNYSFVRVVRAEVRTINAQDRPASGVRSRFRNPLLPAFGQSGAVMPGGIGQSGVRPAGPGASPFNPLNPINGGPQHTDDNEPKADPWEDPLVPGESMEKDSIITLVAAVELDPKPVNKDNGNTVASNQP